MASITGVYQETCKEGDAACLNRNIKRLLDALGNDINNKIDDQSQGIAFGQKQLEQNVITSTNNKIDQTERNLTDNINAVFAKAYETNKNVNDISDYLYNEQADALHDIQNGIDSINSDISSNINSLSKDIDNLSQGLGHAQDNINNTIKNELKVSSAMLEGQINKHDLAVIQRFESVSERINTTAKQTNTNIDNTVTETNNNIKVAAAGLKKEVDNIVSNATSQVTDQMRTIEEKRQSDSWDIFEGFKQWVEGLFNFSPEQIASTIMSLTDIASLVGNKMKNKDQG